MKELSDLQLEKLKEPLPSESLSEHPTKSYLTSIKAIYVTERLNDVFGVGKWTIKTKHITTTEKGMVVVKVILEIPEYGIYYECFGGNDNGGENSKNFDLGDAYKGATTDAITKIGSYLGIGIDVFKGKSKVNSNNNSSQKPNINKWLSEEKYKEAISSKEKAKLALDFYDGKTERKDGIYSMKKEYRDSLIKFLKS